MDIKCVVFDLDDTLILSEKRKQQFFYEIVADQDNSKSLMDNILNNLTKNDDRFSIVRRFAEACLKGGNKEEIGLYAEKLANDYSEKVENMVAKCDEVKGAKSLLNRLKSKGVSMSLSSATPEEGLRKSIKKRGWTDYFDNVFGRPATKLENLEKIARLGNFHPSEVVMVGDGDNDRVGAAEFGCHFIGVKSETKRFKVPVKYIVNDMTEVMGIIKSL
ncbi:MAG: HAD family hydrolase [Alphaproteobacteria bacterium]|nr:HAD family hydrolase [Alphaproteobacteria bacterium]